ncbi:PP2C family protein-serine/threonine phosphatase [Paraoerskovia marina]|uniref:PP2C family protein-serine/threonine phosphatase n=1 Tax=Paraoerskovia marina TaxID=545619 RepID=UPI0009DEF82E|nr:SpoIIE family protein phosphatase [Paraoerskovia marina]
MGRDVQDARILPSGAAAEVDYHAVFASLVAPKMVLSRDLVVLEVNDAYVESRGLPRSVLIGRHLLDIDPAQRLATPQSVDTVVAAIKRVVQSGRYEIVEPHKLDVVGPDGSHRERYILPTAMPVHTKSYEVSHVVLRLEDVTSIFRPAEIEEVPAEDSVPRALAIRSSVEEIGRKVARERQVTLQLQDSVLTEPPPTPGLSVDVRYRPAPADSNLGGDWYDVVVRADGWTIVVVGDVMGHDMVAAVSMAQLRGVLRTVAYDSVGPPGEILDRAEEIAAGLHLGDLTAVNVVAVSPEEAGGHRDVLCARAGSLPPVVHRAAGPTHLVDAPVGALLGLRLPAARESGRLRLGPGDSILVFTDGLIERRGEMITDSLGRLCDVVARLDDASPRRLSDAVLTACLPELEDDDVALVVLRVDPPGTDTLAS